MDLKTTYKNGDLLPAEDINAITTAIIALQDDFSDTDEQLSTLNEKVSENEENIANLENKLESDYLKKDELGDYATNEQLQSVSQQLQDKADKSELSKYATKEDLDNITFETISEEDIDNLYEDDTDDRFRIVATKGKSIVKYLCMSNNTSIFGGGATFLEYSKDGETYSIISTTSMLLYKNGNIELEEGEVLYLRRLPEYIKSTTGTPNGNNLCRIIVEGETEESEVKFKGNLMYMHNYNDITEVPTLTNIFQSLFTESPQAGTIPALNITNHWAKIDASGCEIPNIGWATTSDHIKSLFRNNLGLVKSPKLTDETDYSGAFNMSNPFYGCSNLREITFLAQYKRNSAISGTEYGDIKPIGVLYYLDKDLIYLLPSGWEVKEYPPTKVLDYDGLKYYNDKVMGYIAGGGEVDMSNYYTKSEVDGKLGGLATKAEITDFVTKSEADKFATKDDISEFITEDSLEPYAKKSELTGLATKEELKGYATTTETQSITQQLQNKADRSELDSLATKEQLNSYATKSELSSKADKSELDKFAEKTELNGYATKDEISGLASKSELTDLATKNELNELKDKAATKEELKSYATKSELDGYATKEDLDNIPTKDELDEYPTKEDLKNYPTKDDLSDYATKTELGDYAKKTDLSDLATKEELNAKADKSELSGLATKAELDGYVTNGELSQQLENKADKTYVDEKIAEESGKVPEDITKRLGQAELDINELKQNTNGIATQLNSNIQKTNSIEQTVNNHTTQIDDINKRIDGLQPSGDYVTRTEFELVENQVSDVESSVSNLGGRVDDVYGMADDAQNRVSELENNFETLDGRVSTLEQGGGGQPGGDFATKQELTQLAEDMTSGFEELGKRLQTEESKSDGFSAAFDSVNEALNAKADKDDLTQIRSDIQSVTTTAKANKTALNGLSFWYGTQSEYDKLGTYTDNVFYIIKED